MHPTKFWSARTSALGRFFFFQFPGSIVRVCIVFNVRILNGDYLSTWRVLMRMNGIGAVWYVCVCLPLPVYMWMRTNDRGRWMHSESLFTIAFFSDTPLLQTSLIVYFVINNMNQSEICPHCIRFSVRLYGCMYLLIQIHTHTREKYYSYPWCAQCHFNSFERNKSISHFFFLLRMHFSIVYSFSLTQLFPNK